MEVRRRNISTQNSDSQPVVIDHGQTKIRSRFFYMRIACLYTLAIWFALLVFGYFVAPFYAIDFKINTVDLEGALTPNEKLSQGIR